MRFNFFTILLIFSVLRLVFKNVAKDDNKQKTDKGNLSQKDSVKKAKRIVENMGDQYDDIFGSMFAPEKSSGKKGKDKKGKDKKAGYWEDIFNPTTNQPKKKKTDTKAKPTHSAEGQSLEGYSMHMRGYDEDDMDHKRKAAKAYHKEKVQVGEELLVENIQETSESNVGLNLFGFAGGDTDKSEIRRAIVYSEIFGKPKSMRRR